MIWCIYMCVLVLVALELGKVVHCGFWDRMDANSLTKVFMLVKEKFLDAGIRVLYTLAESLILKLYTMGLRQNQWDFLFPETMVLGTLRLISSHVGVFMSGWYCQYMSFCGAHTHAFTWEVSVGRLLYPVYISYSPSFHPFTIVLIVEPFPLTVHLSSPHTSFLIHFDIF